MPTFDFTSPDGKSYSVDGPDGATKEQAFQILQQQLGNASPPQVGIGEDLAKSAASIPGRILASAAGLPADIAHMYATNPNDANPLGSEALKKDLHSDYQAQRLPGQLTQTAGDFLPAIGLGPEALAMKLATRVAAPTLASEAAGAVTDNPWIKAGAGLVGMGGATKAARDFQAMAAARNAAKELPSGEQILKAGSAGFDKSRDMNIVVKPDFAESTAADMRDAIKGYNPKGVALVHDSINDLENLAKSTRGLPPTAVEMNAIENVRQQLSSLRTNADESVRSAAKKAQLALTENQMKLAPGDVLSGDASLYAKTMQDAVKNYAVGKRSLIVQGKESLGDLNAGTAGVGANGDNALRQAFKQLARPIPNTNTPVATKFGFNAPEIEAIKNVSMGGPVGNTARYIGKYAPTGVVSTASSVGLGHLVGGPFTAALPAVGYIAKKIGDLSTRRAVAALDSLVRSRSPLSAQVAAQLPPEVVRQLPAKTQRILQSISIANHASGSQIPQQIGQAISQTGPQ